MFSPAPQPGDSRDPTDEQRRKGPDPRDVRGQRRWARPVHRVPHDAGRSLISGIGLRPGGTGEHRWDVLEQLESAVERPAADHVE